MVFRSHLNSFLLTCSSCSRLNLLQYFEFCKLRTWSWLIKHDSTLTAVPWTWTNRTADFSVDFIQNLFQNCCLNDSHKMRVSFLKMRCFPLIWDAIFAFIGCFGEVSLATEIILAVGEVAFIYNLNIWTVFFFLFCLTRSGLLGIIFWSWVTEVYIIQSSSWRNPSCNSQWPWNTLSFLQWALLLFSARTTNL